MYISHALVEIQFWCNVLLEQLLLSVALLVPSCLLSGVFNARVTLNKVLFQFTYYAEQSDVSTEYVSRYICIYRHSPFHIPSGSCRVHDSYNIYQVSFKTHIDWVVSAKDSWVKDSERVLQMTRCFNMRSSSKRQLTFRWLVHNRS